MPEAIQEMGRLTDPVEEAAARSPCASCTIGQDCCTHLSGLRITEVEFARCFAPHADKLLIERDGPIYVITPKSGICPNWGQGGCRVYDVRPRDCRLFPFTLFVRRRENDRLSLGYHSDTHCPLKNRLLPSGDEAEEILRGFGREAVPGATIEVARETGFEQLKRRTLRSGRSVLAALKNLLLMRHIESSTAPPDGESL